MSAALALAGVAMLTVAHAMDGAATPTPGIGGYCDQLATSLGDAEKAAQIATLGELEEKLKQRIAELTARQSELREALRQRDETARRAEAARVEIYGKMKPESAAAHLSIMDEPMAAALLSKLNARTASAVLAEIAPARAAKLAELMGSAGARPAQKKS